MKITVNDAYLADLRGMKLLSNLPRPRVPFVAEMFDGALCLWNTRGTGSHVDNIRLDPTRPVEVARLLTTVQTSSLRVPGGSVFIRGVQGTIGEQNQVLLDRLASAPASTGYLMARSLEDIQHDRQPHIRVGSPVRVSLPQSEAEYLAVRRLVDNIFRGGTREYDPETDFYSAPGTVTYLAAWDQDEVTSGASVLIVDGIANIWSVATRESARGRGVASLVVHACMVEARRLGAHAASLGTSEVLARPDGLYNRLGFETIGYEVGWTINDVDNLDLQLVNRVETHDSPSRP